MWRIVVGVLVLLGIGIVGFCFPAFWPIPLAVGALLILAAIFTRPKPKAIVLSGDTMEQNAGMDVPEVWNEQEISLGIDRYKSNPNLLGKYVDGIVSRFVMAQDMRTMEVRSKFLETFNRHAEIARQSYKWHRYLKGGRAALEEDLEDLQAKVKLQQARNELAEVQSDPELLELQKKAKRAELLLQIAQSERAIADLNKPDAPPQSHGPSAHEIRERKKAALVAREHEVREAIRLTKADPTLDEEQKQRKLNALDEKLAELHEEQTALL